MGVLPFSCRDGAGASAVGLLAPKAISVICFELDGSYGKVTEGRREEHGLPELCPKGWGRIMHEEHLIRAGSQ